MTTIPETALQKYAQLNRLTTIAAATAAGLVPDVDHWRSQVTRIAIGLSEVRRQYGEITLGPGGEAYLSRTKKTTSKNSGHRIETYESVDERRPELDSHTLPLFNAQQRLEEARDQHAAASARTGQLRRVVEDARRALQERGWRGDR